MSELKKGDLVIVVSRLPCCGKGERFISHIFEISIIGFEEKGICSACSSSHKKHLLLTDQTGGLWLASTVRKIEPLREKEEEHDYIGSVA